MNPSDWGRMVSGGLEAPIPNIDFREQAIRGAIGSLWMTLYGAIAASVLFWTNGVHLVLAEVYLIPAALCGLPFLLIGEARRLPRSADVSSSVRSRRVLTRDMKRKIGIVFGIYITSIAVVDAILYFLNHVALMIPIDILIVGVHFFPLARVFNVPEYNLTGSILIGVTIIVIATVSPFDTIGLLSAWTVLVLLGDAAALWFTAVQMQIKSRRACTEAVRWNSIV